MTRPRFDDHSTEFGLWLRVQPELSSSLGYAATNIDYLWCDYKNDKWMLIEEKRYGAKVSYSQGMLLRRLILAARKDPTFHGFKLIQFERTSPEDGRTFVNKCEVSKDDLIRLLRFEK